MVSQIRFCEASQVGVSGAIRKNIEEDMAGRVHKAEFQFIFYLKFNKINIACVITYIQRFHH